MLNSISSTENKSPREREVSKGVYEYRKLRGRIVEKFGTQGKFAEAVKLSENSLSKKLNCKVPLTQEEIRLWSELLDIKQSQYAEYFFA
jgi:hypothetical protein